MNNIKKIKLLVLFFIIALVLSGVTAMPIETELRYLVNTVRYGTRLYYFLNKVYIGILDAKEKYPFLFYGYDWLAFAHFMFGILFIGVYKNPVRNIWIVEFGMLCCIAIIPFALLAGHFREIPLYWRLIDCSFGIFGFISLWYCYKLIKKENYA
jgi:hypothetical protein